MRSGVVALGKPATLSVGRAGLPGWSKCEVRSTFDLRKNRTSAVIGTRFMAHCAQSAYVQARLQARHGERPTDGDWLQLEGARTVDAFLERTGAMGLVRFTERIGDSRDTHVVELRLREARRAYVAEVADWMPPSWRRATLWAGYLPELPAISHLIAGKPVPNWMRADPLLALLADATQADRSDLLADIGFAPLGLVDREPVRIAEIWIAQWRALWPTMTRNERDHLQRLLDFSLRHVRAARASAKNIVEPPSSRQQLSITMIRLFRAAHATPASAFAHLALVALDIERLRGGLVRRLVLQGNGASEAA